jgi:uncharacterized protein YhaN
MTKIERLKVHALGGLRGFDTGTAALRNFVVLLGTNEAGKTTVMEAVRALLHGFRPASRENHPLTPWEGDAAAEIEGWVAEADGGRAHVRRRLLAKPTTLLHTLPAEGWEPDPNPLALHNQTLPMAAGVDREVYVQTHTLTLPELARFGSSAPWLDIRDRILAGMGTGDMMAPRALATLLDAEARQLWRPTRRGSTEYSALEFQHREARDRLEIALKEAHELRQATASLAELRTLLPAAQDERARLQEHLNKARQREADAARAREDAEARKREATRHQATIEALRGRVHETAAPLLVSVGADQEFPEAYEAQLEALPLEAVRGALTELDHARTAQATADALLSEQGRRPAPEPPRGSPPSTFRILIGLGALVAGVALYLLVAGEGSNPTPALLALVGGAAMVGAATWIRRDQARARDAHARASETLRTSEERARSVAKEAAARTARAHEALRGLLAGLPLRAEVLDEAREGLDRDLLLLRERLLDLRRAESRTGGEAPTRNAPTHEAANHKGAQTQTHEETPDAAMLARETAEAARALEAAQERVETLREEIRIHEDRLQRASTTSPDLVRGEILGLEADMARILRDRDRLRVLQALVTEGEERFRNREQPVLLRQAGALLHALTAGRYDGLGLEPGADEALTVRGSHLPAPKPVDTPLSTGTREQIWFALRIAALEGVEKGSQPLPLILDEVLVNWDAGRRLGALSGLAHLSSARQIFFLTCHPTMAAEAESVGAQVLRLPTPTSALTSTPTSTLTPGPRP